MPFLVPPLAMTVAGLRCAVGVVLLARPSLATNGDDGRKVLVQTIGIRDLVIGAGTLVAGTRVKNPRLWVQSSLASDVADVLVAVAARRQLGRSGALVAALSPLPFVVAGVRVLTRTSG